jgi:hypothetical protein
MDEKQTIALAVSDVEWWKTKVVKMGNRTFGPICTQWAIHVLDVLLDRPSGEVRAASLSGLARSLGVPLKFASRAIVTLLRVGVVSGELHGTFDLTLKPDNFKRHKNAGSRERRGVRPLQSVEIKKRSNFTCAWCETTFDKNDLEVDHLVPLGLWGADAPENWVVLCRTHNRDKWDRFLRGRIKQYQGERVTRPCGVRFVDGCFWPVINGRLRRSRQAVGT